MPDQRETLKLFLALQAFESAWGGKLFLHLGLDRNLALAALAAGAASLILERDDRLLRDSQADVTFTVNTLDEAVRTLKNEVRQERAITVALSGDSSVWLRQMEKRGVQPDVIAGQSDSAPAVQLFKNARRFHPARTEQKLIEDAAGTLRERRDRDADLCKLHPAQARWLHAAPAIFPRDLSRWYLDHE